MKTTIFYFSGTGNNLKIARDLAAELGDSEIISIAKAVKGQAGALSGRIGFVFPIYAFGMPLIVSEFVDKLKIEKGAYIFAVMSYAGVAANGLGQLARLLKAKGLNLSAGFLMKMPSNYTPFGGAMPAAKQEKLFSEESRRVKEIAGFIKENRPGKIEGAGPILRFLGDIISFYAKRVMRGEDKNFWITAACDGCGICAKVCPVNNINMVSGKPVWLHICEQCFACLQWCPQEAIQCGRSTMGRRRYRNPYVSLKDFIN